MKKLYKISDFFTNEDSRFVLSGYAPTNSEHEIINVITKEDFFDAVTFKYGERSVFIPETSTPLETFYRLWAAFCRRRSASIAAGMYVLGLNYNPIENYNSTETHTGTDTDLKTPTGWKSEETQEPTNWKKDTTETFTNYKETETQTPNDWIFESTKDNNNNEVNKGTSLYAFNSSNPVPVTNENTTEKLKLQEEQKGTFETSKEFTGTKGVSEEQTGSFKTTTEQKGTLEDKTTYNSEIKKSGNIGVTTTQQMAQSELELRKIDFVESVLAEFFTTNTIYC